MHHLNEIDLLAEAAAKTRSGEGRRLRELIDIPGAVIAREIGVHRSALSHWEASPPRRIPRGETAIRYALVLRRLERCAKALNVTADKEDA
jgi:transcriptional regulator with XRE-family HTH domain